jgi:hypothetical protein
MKSVDWRTHLVHFVVLSLVAVIGAAATYYLSTKPAMEQAAKLSKENESLKAQSDKLGEEVLELRQSMTRLEAKSRPASKPNRPPEAVITSPYNRAIVDEKITVSGSCSNIPVSSNLFVYLRTQEAIPYWIYNVTMFGNTWETEVPVWLKDPDSHYELGVYAQERDKMMPPLNLPKLPAKVLAKVDVTTKH